MKQEILSYLDKNCPCGGSFHYYKQVNSTNTLAKEMAKQGAPHGTVIVAGSQSAGRGRMGRTFVSPEGSLYYTMLLRPCCAPAQLMHLTCAVAVAACQAVEKAAGFRPDIKWVNDLQWQGKKLGGILTELGFTPDGMVDYAIIGIGINCRTVPQEVSDIADSLTHVSGKDISPAPVAAALTQALWEMAGKLLSSKSQIMDTYRQSCVTLGKPVQVLGKDIHGIAKAITDEGALVLALPDGEQMLLNMGEVSVRMQNAEC